MATSSKAVNRPTDVKVKEADVNRKLQFYGIATAFQAGKVPSNDQIDVALNSFLNGPVLSSPSSKLSSEGQALVKDTRDVVEQAKYLLLSKNEGNLLQDFIWQCQKIEGGDAQVPGLPVDNATAKQHGNQALDGLQTLGTLIITNGQFRKLLNDAMILMRDIAGDAATQAAGKVKPSDEQLAQIDHPAADNVWHDAPDMSKGNIKQQLKAAYDNNAPIKGEHLREAAGNAAQTAHPGDSRDPADAAALAAQEQQTGTQSGIDAQGGVQAGVDTLRQRASENIPEETKDQARERRDRTKAYFQKKMPQDRRDQVVWRLKKMVIECQGHPDYQQAITTLLDLAETYGGHANTIGQQSTGAIKGAHTDSALKTAEDDLKTLIERFANGTSTNDLFDSINNIYRDADQDPELKNWFKQIDAYIRKCLQQQGYIMEDAATNEWNALYDRGNFLLRERYRNHTDRIVDEVKFLANQFDEDPQNKRFAQSLNKLFSDLGNDENGKPTFKPHLIKDLTEVILPAIFENVRYVPIPRIEYSDPQVDAIIENLVVESDNLMPNVLEIASDNYWRWGRKNVASKNMNSIMASVSGIQMDLRDVSYYVKRKQGFPSITDQGIANIFLGGSGFSFKMKMSTADKSASQNFFKVDKVEVNVKNFDIQLVQSKKKFLFGIAKPLMLRVLRPALQKAIEKAITEKVHEFDSFLYQIKLEADRAQQEIVENPDQAQNIYQRYVNAAQKQVMQGKQKAQKAQAAASNVKFNVAMTKEDSIFPNIHLPGGISSKATEYRELALKGDNWESPVFSLGDASKSNDIPHAAEVTRKDHQVTTGGVRGPENVGKTEPFSSQLNDPAAQAAGTTTTTGATTTGTGVNGNYTNGSYANGNYANGNSTNGNYTNGTHTNGNYTSGKVGQVGGNTAGYTNPVTRGI